MARHPSLTAPTPRATASLAGPSPGAWPPVPRRRHVGRQSPDRRPPARRRCQAGFPPRPTWAVRKRVRLAPKDPGPKDPGPTAVAASAPRSLQRLPPRSPLPLLDGGLPRRDRPLVDRTSRRHRYLSCNHMARNGPYRTGHAPKTAPEAGRQPRKTAAETGLPPDHHLRRRRRVGRTVATAGCEFLRETTAPRAGMLPTTVMLFPSSRPRPRFSPTRPPSTRPPSRPASRRPSWPVPRRRAADCAPRAR
jgi:hypothetical protein